MRILVILASAAILSTMPVGAPLTAQAETLSLYTYADLADLASAGSIVAAVEVRSAMRLRAGDAPGVAPGSTRFLMTADVVGLLKGAQGLPGQISWLADLPDVANRPVRIRRKTRFLLLANPVEGQPGQVRLVAPQGQMTWDAALEQRLRAILTESAAADAPPRVTGIGNAFHVPGAIPGESETQIFLTTDDGRPVSLSILRRPGEDPRWAVALAEMVDDSAAPPQRDTLLWYRLACFLPRALPDSVIGDMSADDQAATRADYQFVLDGLGGCARTIHQG